MDVKTPKTDKKPWRRPELQVHGTVETMTRSKACPGGDALSMGVPYGDSGPCG